MSVLDRVDATFEFEGVAGIVLVASASAALFGEVSPFTHHYKYRTSTAGGGTACTRYTRERSERNRDAVRALATKHIRERSEGDRGGQRPKSDSTQRVIKPSQA